MVIKLFQLCDLFLIWEYLLLDAHYKSESLVQSKNIAVIVGSFMGFFFMSKQDIFLV